MHTGQTVLVTGGLGHIGSSLIRSLEGIAGEVRILDNLSAQRYASLFDLPGGPRFAFYEDDILSADMAAVLKGVDVVVHLAAMTNAEATVGKEEETEAVNFTGLVRVAEACEAAGIPILFPSSTSVYGSQSTVVDESCGELKPQSPYATAKLKSEEYLSSRKGSLRYVTCRFGTIFGWSIGMRFHTAVNKFIWQAVSGQPITVWKTAWEQKRPYLDLTDCVGAIRFILQKNLFEGELYNVVTDNYTVREVVETIQKNIPNLEVTFVDSAIMNQLSYDVRADKIASEGFTPTGNLAQGILDTISKLGQLRPVS